MNSKRTILTVDNKPFIAIAGEVHGQASRFCFNDYQLLKLKVFQYQ